MYHYLLKDRRFGCAVDKHGTAGVTLTGVLPFCEGTNHVWGYWLIDALKIFGAFVIPDCTDLRVKALKLCPIKTGQNELCDF